MDNVKRQAIAARRAAHWHKTRTMTAILLTLWIVTGFCSAFFARELAQFTLFGWPLSFYMAAQGSSLIYLALIGLYAWRMHRLDLAYARDDAGNGDTGGKDHP